MDNISSFILNKANPIKEFSLRQPNSFVSLRKIVITSLHGSPNIWAPKFNRLNPVIKIRCDDNLGSSMQSSLVISVYITPYHYNPIVEFNPGYIIPESHHSYERRVNYSKIKLELLYSDMEKPETEDLSLTVLYEKTQGVY